MKQSPNYDFLFKTILVGKLGVGKTSLLSKAAGNSFSGEYRYDFQNCTYNLEKTTVRLMVWDPNSDFSFTSITKNYYKDAYGVVLVYDVNERNSFEEILYWLKQTEKYAPENAVKMLIGNKIDLGEQRQRQVQYCEAKQLADSLNMLYFETSVKSSANVETAFLILAETILKRFPEIQNSESVPIQIKKKKSRCQIW